MSTEPGHPERSAAAKARTASGASRGPWIIGTVVVVAIVGALVIAVAVTGGGKDSTGNAALVGRAPTSIVSEVTGVPTAVLDEIGGGTAAHLPTPIPASAAAPASPKPTVLYIGAEFCPYCAAERWALVNALGRFGTFTDLAQTHSSSTDVFPNTATFSFKRSSYRSDVITFTPVETASNEPDGQGGYEKLDTPTAEQARTWQALDPNGSIPFIDLGGRYFISGATVDPGVLANRSLARIAGVLDDPGDRVATAVVGAANGMTAAICESTGGKPAAVCNAKAVAALRSTLASGRTGG